MELKRQLESHVSEYPSCFAVVDVTKKVMPLQRCRTEDPPGRRQDSLVEGPRKEDGCGRELSIESKLKAPARRRTTFRVRRSRMPLNYLQHCSCVVSQK
jgi:hypothetical protein